MSLTTAFFPPARLGLALPIRRGTAIVWGGTALFVLCLFLRSPDLFRHPRFWAEEGSLYYQAMRGLPLGRALGFVANGNYQLLTNLFVEMSLLMPARHAAVPTTYLPLLVAAYACFLMARLLVSRGCGSASVAAACALFALQTAGYEVFLSATNVQWVCSVLALMVGLQDEAGSASRAAWIRYATLAVCGLTGTPSCILLPAFVLLACLRPSRYRWALVLVLAAATAVEAGVIVAHAAQLHRPFEAALRSVTPFVLQAVLAAVVPVDMLDGVGEALRAGQGHTAGMTAQLAMLGFVGIALVVVLGRDRLGRVTATVLVTAAVTVGLINEFGALGGIGGLFSGWAGARYFFLASTCLVVLLAAGLSADPRSSRAMAGLLVAACLGNAVVSRLDARWSAIFQQGPSLAAQVDRCGVGAPCRVTVWPQAVAMTVDILPDPPATPPRTESTRFPP